MKLDNPQKEENEFSELLELMYFHNPYGVMRTTAHSFFNFVFGAAFAPPFPRRLQRHPFLCGGACGAALPSTFFRAGL